MISQLSVAIHEIIADYRCDECDPLQPKDVIKWVNQFDETDREFILTELLHLLNQEIYLSKEKAKELLWENFKTAAYKLGYSNDLNSFIFETHFFKVQGQGKSQSVLYEMLNERVVQVTGLALNTDAGRFTKNYIYIDDVLATGGTVLKHLKGWLQEEEGRIEKVEKREIKYVVSVFCVHQWAFSNISWILKSHFKSDTLLNTTLLIANYSIENLVRFTNAKLNLAYPAKGVSEKAEMYLQALNASDHHDKAFRNILHPQNETFFSSPANRNRFEKIIMEKGIEILEKVKHGNMAHRPLGDTYPHYKTLGTGTLFFTWRNISNTCPLVFWWDNPVHKWKGLFPLRNRGN